MPRLRPSTAARDAVLDSAPVSFTWRDLLGLGWASAAAVSVLVPALLHGVYLGSYQILATPNHGLTTRPGVPATVEQTSDLIGQMIPWTRLAWEQVHHGHLPLWNPYNGLGTPLAFNWQSAPFSLSSVLTYLVPLRLAFTAAIAVNLLVAASGAYVLGRVLRMGAIGAAMVGTVFVLSGPFAAWLGFPFASVNCWAGWILAFGILAIRARRPMWATVATALSIAGMLYGGQPEGATVLLLAVGAFFGLLLAHHVDRRGWTATRAPAFRLIGAATAGVGLALPLVLPGTQLSALSIRRVAPPTQALPGHLLAYLAFQGYDGLPLPEVAKFGLSGYLYNETAAYVGMTALVLALIAMVVRWRRPEIRALAAVVAICLALVYFGPLDALADRIPLVGTVSWWRALMPLALALAVLAGSGIDAIVRQTHHTRSARWLGAGFGSAAVVLAALWLFDRGGLHGNRLAVRDASFVWPVACVLVGIVVAAALYASGRDRPGRSRRWNRYAAPLAGMVLLATETVFLLSAGAPLVQSSPVGLPRTSAIRAYARTVGTATVGFGSTLCGLGLPPDVNDAYGVHELDDYDPSLPAAYFTGWQHVVGTPPGFDILYLFCPDISTVSVAREYGVTFLLEQGKSSAPPGTVFVRRLGNESLYRVPGSGAATLTPLQGPLLPPAAASGRPVNVTSPDPSTWAVTYRASRPSVLRLHLSDVPGWHATIDGHPLRLQRYAGLMMEARVPAGHHDVVLTYWPSYFTVGLVAAGLSAVGLAVAVAVDLRHRRARHRHDN